VKTWQNRQLDAVYPIMYLDAIQFKVRDNGHVKNKAIYLAIGVKMNGLKEVLGLWIAQNGRREILAAGGDGVEEPGRDRHLYRLC